MTCQKQCNRGQKIERKDGIQLARRAFAPGYEGNMDTVAAMMESWIFHPTDRGRECSKISSGHRHR